MSAHVRPTTEMLVPSDTAPLPVDDLDPMRGLLAGCVISTALWLLICLLII